MLSQSCFLITLILLCAPTDGGVMSNSPGEHGMIPARVHDLQFNSIQTFSLPLLIFFLWREGTLELVFLSVNKQQTSAQRLFRGTKGNVYLRSFSQGHAAQFAAVLIRKSSMPRFGKETFECENVVE